MLKRAANIYLQNPNLRQASAYFLFPNAWRYISILICLVLLDPSAAYASTTVLTLNTVTKPPLTTPERKGFLDRVTSEALNRIGIKLQTLALPAERALLDANAGILDGELSRVPGLEKTYTNLLLIPEKIMDVEFTVFSIKYDKIKPGWNGLANYSVAFLNGWKILERNVPASAEITKVQSPTQLFNLLELDRVDFIIYDKWGGIALAKSMHIEGVIPLSPPLAVRGLHIYLHKKHKNLVEPLTNSIQQLKADGVYQKIYDETLGSRPTGK